MDIIWKAWSHALIYFACWTALELVYPAEKMQDHAGKLRNIFIGALALSLGYYCGALVSGFLKEHFTVGPLVDLNGTLPLLLAPFVAVWVYDFFYYWFHRLQHTWKPLWALHSLHHSDTDVNVTTATRHHWLEDSLKAVFIGIPMGLLVKLPAENVFLLSLLLSQWGYFIHANLKIPLGPLTPLIGGPQLHRVHHSILPEHRDKNFAAYLPLWDVIFGTYHKPEGWPRTGIAEHDGKVWAGTVIWPLISRPRRSYRQHQ